MKTLKISPKISAVIPVYNMEKFLKNTLDSILNQTFKDFELIIVDNGSTDNSMKILKEYAKRDKRILIKSIPGPNGVGAANQALDFAKGKYISKMDADDIYLPNKLQVQYDYLEKHPEVFLVGNSAFVIDERGNKIGVFRKFNNPKKLRKKLLKGNPFIHSSIMYRNLKGLRYRERFHISEEYDMYLRLIESGKILTNLPDILMKYMMREKSLVSTKSNQIFFFEKAKKFHYQREKYGKDDYENLSPPKDSTEMQDFKKVKYHTFILAKFHDNQMKEVRKQIKDYFREYGFSKNYLIFYVLSFIPYRITNFFIKNF